MFPGLFDPVHTASPQLFNEGGIPIEPFHLRAEREEGYFDAEVRVRLSR